MDFRATLLEQTRAFGDLIRSGDPATPVPTCGEWTLKQLYRHVGRGNRWAAQIITERRNQPLDPREVRDGRPPDDPDAAAEWLQQGAQPTDRVRKLLEISGALEEFGAARAATSPASS